MKLKLLLLLPVLVLLPGMTLIQPCAGAAAGSEVAAGSGYKVLEPVRQGNLTIFPIVVAKSHNTEEFLTLDEGLRSGEVVVTESGNVSPLVRPRGTRPEWREGSGGAGAQVNRLVLVNNSKRPLILLAGEIVTGGKQDRVIGKDRLVPAESDPIDLSVFCVEPGRWTATKANFGGFATAMAQPAVRGRAMADKDQAKVWQEVGKSREAIVAEAGPATPRALAGTSSYARVMDNQEVKEKVNSVAEPIQRNYASLIKQLRDRNAVGVVVAVNGEIIWADVFASADLLAKYWPKLVRSYAAEAIATRAKGQEVRVKAAQEFLDQMEGRRETVESEPGLYRHTEITGDGFKAFELTSLLPKTGFDLHVAKMAD
jgi:hypothetical protein